MSELVEYPHGAAFPGVIGRTIAESSPAWPQPLRARDGSPNVLFVVLDDVGYGQLSAVRRPGQHAEDRPPGRQRPALRQHAHDGALLADARVHPHRPQPPLQRRGGDHGDRDRLPRLRRPHAVRERDALGDAARARLQHVLRRQVASDPERGVDAGRPVPPLAARARVRALLRLPRRRDQPVVPGPDVRQPLGRRSPSGPDEGYHLSEDLTDKAIQFILDAHVNAPDKPFFLYYAPGAAHAPHQVGPEWIEKYHGKFDVGWDAYRETVFASQKELGIMPADAELSRARSGRTGVGHAERRREAALRALHGGLRRLPRARRPSLRPHPRRDRGDRRARQHAGHDRSPTTAPAPRAASPARSTR